MRINCSPENAPKFFDWVKNRGGVLHWPSIDLSNLEKSWSSPALTPEGLPYRNPHWQSANEPDQHAKSLEEIDVIKGKEYKRIKIALQKGSGFRVDLTINSSHKVRHALSDAGKESWYTFEDREAVIWIPDGVETLADWAIRNKV